MELLNFLKDTLHIDVVIVLLVIFSGFFQEKYLCGFAWSKDTKHDASLKTLAVSFAASVIYIILFHFQYKGVPIVWATYFISYFVATSVYELFIRPIRKRILKETGEPDDDQPQKL